MSSRGSKAKNGHVTTDEYEQKPGTISEYDEKVLIGKGNNHSLPDYSHTPNRKYIKENADGSFREMRVYGEYGEPLLEIAFHAEPSINEGKHNSVLHYHVLTANAESVTDITRSRPIKLSQNSTIYKTYRKYLRRYGL